MTKNQRHAVELARGIIQAPVVSIELADEEWALLLLAADLCGTVSRPGIVARGVLDQCEQQMGYFANTAAE